MQTPPGNLPGRHGLCADVGLGADVARCVARRGNWPDIARTRYRARGYLARSQVCLLPGRFVLMNR